MRLPPEIEAEMLAREQRKTEEEILRKEQMRDLGHPMRENYASRHEYRKALALFRKMLKKKS